MCTLVLRDEHLVSLLDLEGIIPSVDLRKSRVDAGHIGRMDVARHDELYIFGCLVGSPYASPGKEEPLLWSESVLYTQ